MKNILLFTLLTCLTVLTTSCKDDPPHRVVGHRAAVNGKFLQAENGYGRYTYQGDNGTWFIYYWLLLGNNGPGYNSTYYQNVTTLPAGGSWKVASAPTKEEVVAEEQETVAENETGLPETEQEFEVENQSTEPENTVESEPASESSPSESPAESSPSDSGSDSGSSGGDSGGGGDGGGSSD